MVRRGSTPLGAGDHPAPAGVLVARLVVAVLAGVQQVDLGQVAEAQPPVQGHGGASGRAAQRQVLPGRPVGGRPAAHEGDRVAVLGGMAAGVVVLDLVVVEGDQERVAGVGGLEVAVGLVQGVADPVASQVGRLAANMAAGQVAPGRVLIEVVAQVQDHVTVVLGQVPIGGVVAALEVLAGHHGQVQAAQGAARVRAGPGAADPAEVAAGPEPVPVVAARVEAVHLDVDGVGVGRGGGDPAPAGLRPGTAGRWRPPSRPPPPWPAGRRRGRAAGAPAGSRAPPRSGSGPRRPPRG
jgi:hypothetical protein